MTLYIFDLKPLEVSLMFAKGADVIKIVCFFLFADQFRKHQSLPSDTLLIKALIPSALRKLFLVCTNKIIYINV